MSPNHAGRRSKVRRGQDGASSIGFREAQPLWAWERRSSGTSAVVTVERDQFQAETGPRIETYRHVHWFLGSAPASRQRHTPQPTQPSIEEKSQPLQAWRECGWGSVGTPPPSSDIPHVNVRCPDDAFLALRSRHFRCAHHSQARIRNKCFARVYSVTRLLGANRTKMYLPS